MQFALSFGVKVREGAGREVETTKGEIYKELGDTDGQTVAHGQWL